MLFAIGKDILYASILSRIQVQTCMIFTGSTMNVARDHKGAVSPCASKLAWLSLNRDFQRLSPQVEIICYKEIQFVD
jgi:hypothetical protein